MQLEDGSEVVIAGGGPAGSFSAIKLKDYADEMGLDVKVTILEQKIFSERGKPGCNFCAGGISSLLVDNLDQIGLSIPPNVVQRYIRGFTFETANESLTLEDEEQHMVTVFRGSGPRDSDYEGISFDGFLRDEAVKRGVDFVNTRVTSIEPPQSLEDRVKISIRTSPTAEEIIYEADLLIGALGIPGAYIFEQAGFGYKRAETVKLAQTEIKMDPEKIQKEFGQHIHLYFLNIPGVRYAAIAPKGEYVTVTVMSSNPASKDTGKSMNEKLDLFLRHEKISPKIMDGKGRIMRSCFCTPEMISTDSVQPYSDRIVIVGDAAYTRLYKNGIEAAFRTADMAVRAAIEHGVSKEDFERHYHSQAHMEFNRDNWYGRKLFAFDNFFNLNSRVIDEHFRVANKDTPNGERLKRMFWSMFAGDRPYRDIFYDIFDPKHPGPLLELGVATLKGLVPYRR